MWNRDEAKYQREYYQPVQGHAADALSRAPGMCIQLNVEGGQVERYMIFPCLLYRSFGLPRFSSNFAGSGSAQDV
jgi:hypothetical protein